jgi:hypothetical protein
MFLRRKFIGEIQQRLPRSPHVTNLGAGRSHDVRAKERSPQGLQILKFGNERFHRPL